ncbi:helix-turn-helix transcriptional regulator [Komagataeibacter sp. FNDCR2]|uniref:helix-turn-helix transcriptional regulator n=1 Tax=Komagataeibacter sp. FNDCR2 TaxID=2878682 RepID=UPI001E289AC2|nr:helix-turn-helix transcriptional regulator [Komagataeibacter sp. FNDCR2]MCE2576065.1 helix-turn-helix transcriptional regulator [Komagataeibacter sp. FNDCR2]
MISHTDIWRALDRLAAERGLTPSGLARAAGLDSTTFNPSKRITPAGRPRWPGTESLARTLSATGISFEGFSRLLSGHHDPETGGKAHHAHLKIVSFSQLTHTGLFDETGLPEGGSWEKWDFHGMADHHSYAVHLDSDCMEPIFRKGGTLIISPTAAIRQSDRVLLHTPHGAPCCGMVTDRWHDAPVTAPLHELVRIHGLAGMDDREIVVDGNTLIHRITMACM